MPTYPALVIPRHFILMIFWVRSVKRLGSHALTLVLVFLFHICLYVLPIPPSLSHEPVGGSLYPAALFV